MKMVFVLKFTGEGNGICALSFCIFQGYGKTGEEGGCWNTSARETTWKAGMTWGLQETCGPPTSGRALLWLSTQRRTALPCPWQLTRWSAPCWMPNRHWSILSTILRDLSAKPRWWAYWPTWLTGSWFIWSIGQRECQVRMQNSTSALRVNTFSRIGCDTVGEKEAITCYVISANATLRFVHCPY